MDRKDFIKKTLEFGLCSGAVAALGAVPLCCAAGGAEEKNPQGTPCEKKQEFAQVWVKRFFNLLDAQLDEPTRTKLLESMGEACYRGSLDAEAIQSPKPVDVDKLVEGMQAYGGPEMARREGNVIYFQYVKNPAGLKVADGWCLCPLVESGPPGLSGAYCQCSVGYVRAMFSRALGKPVQVKLTESLKRGGEACRFTIQV
jgi:predicted hydrocarbon binding protein